VCRAIGLYRFAGSIPLLLALAEAGSRATA
jgi:hypothetical protein